MRGSHGRGFTLIELLVVVAIIAITATLFPVFASLRGAAQKTACFSHMRQIGRAIEMYTSEHDQVDPQSKRTEAQPQIADAGGGIEEPDYGSVFAMILPCTGHGGTSSEHQPFRQKLFACPADPAPDDPLCPTRYDLGGPGVISSLVNAYFVWGLTEAEVRQPSQTIYIAERRSEAAGTPPVDLFCDDIYHSWLYPPIHPSAPANEMDEVAGAIAARRHPGDSNYIFADDHGGWRPFSRTFNPPAVNLHVP